MEKTPAELRAETLALFNERIESDRKVIAQIRNGEIPNMFIVRQERGNVCIQYNRSGSQIVPRTCLPENATRFATAKEAGRWASQTLNGAGETAQVVELLEALEEDMTHTEILVTTLQEHASRLV